jgi:AcrR family transcriptional regulator
MVQNHGSTGDGRAARSARTRTDLLAATERIIRRDGVGSLTLERVAEEAGVSKGGLLYHFKSKQDLVRTLLTHTMTQTSDRLEELAAPGGPGAFATAYLDYVRSGEHSINGVAAGIFASAALDEGELAPAQTQFEDWQHRLRNEDGLSPATALLARIVGDGLWLIDLFGLAPPSDGDRGLVLDLVQQLIDEDATANSGN